MMATDVVVIGGGVTGSACAYNLARAGVKVTLLEKHEIACAASGGSAGGVRQQNRALPELPLAMAANPIWKTLEEELEADVEYRRHGHLNMAEREDQVPAMEASVKRQRENGLDIQMVYGKELHELVPAANPCMVAGSYSPGDGFANPILVTRAFAAAARRHGAEIRTKTAVRSIRREKNRVVGVETEGEFIASRWVINAAGAWAMSLCSEIGLDLPIRPQSKQMMVTERAPAMLKPVVACLGRGLSVKQMPQGQFVIGGGWPGVVEMSKDRGWPKQGSPNGSAREMTAVLPPTAGLHVIRVWNSLEACSIDNLPALGEVDGIEGLLVATGFTGHGFALAPSVGKLLTELVVSGKASLPLADLNARRFASCDRDKVAEFLAGEAAKASMGGIAS